MINTARGILYFVALILLQVLVLNNIHFLRMVTPLLYVYFIIKLPVGYTSIRVTFLSFLAGITVDMLSNTSGMHAAACTLAGFVRPQIIRLFIREDLADNIAPSFRSFGSGGFVRFVVVFVMLHHFSLFLIESLTLFDLPFLAIRALAGVATTSILIFIIEAFQKNSRRSDDQY
ncbi:MAG: rod shape-determining protein MreD [Tannerellaceae bacterium]|jgi:rod shape-determining protein MreD|nr:rod shape-determining protein MreD [Tannerellaceae bacterium]